ncbi:MAG TPA: Rieske (2Fe-2S) protein [Chitinophagales bacterium]|nr:Rieske (2Fe-2S) protein [Chitinophagales bacterium]
MYRKDFIKVCGMVCLSGTALSTLLQSCAASGYFAATTVSNKQVTIKKTEFIITGENKSVQRKFVLVNIPQYSFPVAVYKINDEQYSAVLMECTHKGCELRPQGTFLICPCHGSEFSNTGIVQNPPAEENLKTFQITQDHENIYIQL